MIRLFASDLDGTLLNEKHESDDVIESCLQKVVMNGGVFTVATGRSIEMIHLGKADDQIYVICMNGAVIFDPNRQIILQEEIDKESLGNLLKQFPDFYLECISPQKTFLRQDKESYMKTLLDPETVSNRPKNWAKRFRDRAEHHISFSCTDEEILSYPICKVNCMIRNPEVTKAVNEYLDAYRSKLVNAPSFPGGIEITKAGVNKGSGILWLADKLGIQKDEVAVYGDGGNDLEMLKMFTHSYAPNTASEAAIKNASHVIGPYQEYSVVKHIEHTIDTERS